MRRLPTPEEFTRIMAVLEKVHATTKEVSWNGTMEEGRELCKTLSGYKPTKGDCLSCEQTVVNILREAVNLPPLTQPVREALSKHRMDTCLKCKAFNPWTISCGTLVKDALFPKAVTITGKEVTPCGCFLPLKVTMKHATCPGNFW